MQLSWKDVCVIRAFKIDCGTYDTVAVVVEAQDPLASFQIDEDHPQFGALVAGFETHLAGFDQRWHSKVAFPAFAGSETILYQATSSEKDTR
jgi:hypothetical protein